MSSVGLSGLSNISTDGLQARYQKALKQINKLIEINRELKDRVTEYEKEMSSFEQERQHLEQINRELDEENNILDSKYMELKNHSEEVEKYCKELEQEIDNYEINTQHLNQTVREMEMKYHQEIDQEIEKYNALATQAQYAEHTHQEAEHILKRQKQELQAQIDALNQQNAELKQSNAKLTEMLSEKNIVTMQAHLDQANKNIQSLMKQCNELKAKQIDLQVLQERQKVEKYIGLGTSIRQQQGEAVRELIHQYKKKLREVEGEKKEIEQKYKRLKANKNQNNDSYNKKIESLERLTQKQQREIASIIETYDRELNAVLKDNLKIRQAYSMLSHTLTKKGREIIEKERVLSELKMTTDRMELENQSLKRVNLTLKEEKERKLRELIKEQIQNTQSVTLGHIRSHSQHPDSSVNLKASQVQNAPHSSPKQQDDSPFKSEQHKIPITVSYNNGQKGDFKFIQSVNIINGYNVNLGENGGRSNR